MSLLALEHVSKCYRRGRLEVRALRDVSLEVHPAEVVAVWGIEGSGRSALLRIAAGIEPPDGGEVRFRGRPLSVGDSSITGALAYCQPRSCGIGGDTVLDELIGAQLARGLKPAHSKARAWEALERVAARSSAQSRSFELDGAEAVRVSLARAILRGPALLLIDEPTKGVDLLQRDRILELLRSLAKDGISVLMSTDKGTGVFGADRVLSLSNGELLGHTSPQLAEVVRLPMRAGL